MTTPTPLIVNIQGKAFCVKDISTIAKEPNRLDPSKPCVVVQTKGSSIPFIFKFNSEEEQTDFYDRLAGYIESICQAEVDYQGTTISILEEIKNELAAIAEAITTTGVQVDFEDLCECLSSIEFNVDIAELGVDRLVEAICAPTITTQYGRCQWVATKDCCTCGS